MKSNTDTALLLIRVALGLVFLAHGTDKFTNIDDTVAFFASMNLSAFWAYLVATVEVVGAIALLLGVFAGWAGIILAIDMICATILVKLGKGFLGGYEFDLVLFLSSIAIALAGPGGYTLKGFLKKK